eukprot:CAMPEP_0185729146 /NCGR_PEP_ID=MMETSP1171-20130828/4493_1 /TAXON_ID=374046 /ORGANISM="Helicotheca tamensis, Strain CCMP826" /LENGTH=290 /DNA_ID=CAMNT_0028397923 /DNA_START=136 /DNA_END=1008 /DNA_ORIENTATION=-
MSGVAANITAWLDSLTGKEGTLGYIAIAISVAIAIFGHWGANVHSKQIQEQLDAEEEEEPEPPRNFTLEQLKYFDGKLDEKTEEEKPVYLSLNGIVFNVTKGRDFYGPDGPYEMFAGRECGVALAKMSFDETHLDDIAGCSSLNFGEKTELDGWIEKFTYFRSYPVMGKLVPSEKIPSPDRIVSREEIGKNDGSGEIPEGYATAPIYIGAGDKVFDVSFGGVTFYGKGCAYERFAGKNASRALAKMSFDPADTENTDTNDLTEKEKKVLADWAKTFEEKKGYPCVGVLEK